MGYWGCFVVGRDERPLAERDALSGADGIVLRAEAPGGRRVREYAGAGEAGGMRALAERTGAPALFACVMGGDCAVVEAAALGPGAWTTCLGRAAMADRLRPEEDGLTLGDYFLEPRDAAERAVARAAETGHAVAADELLDVLAADPGPMAENLLFRLLDRLGVVPL
ncbi:MULTISPECIES: hypothetical protein [Streptomyces]|uniref:Uncharacterized protein n=1 Tax=Streptomyces fimbriatus TaxID=68197 RepID=A0ABW0CZ32_STRFI